MTANKFYADNFQELSMEVASSLGKQGEKAWNLQQGMQELANSRSISGAGADAMRAYIREVHVSLLGGLISALEGFQTAIATYWAGYEGQDGDGNFQFIKEDFEAHERQLSEARATLEGYRSRLSATAASANSLAGVGSAGAVALMRAEEALERMENLACATRETWDSYEQGFHGFDQVEELLARLEDMVRLYQNGAHVSKGRNYVPGSFFSQAGDFLAAYEAVDAFTRQNANAAGKAWKNLQKDFRADVERAQKKAEKKEGLWGLLVDALQVVGGAVIAVVGLGLTPLSGGFSLGLTALGGMMIVGGVNSGINHASMAISGKGYNLLGSLSGEVGKWYNRNIARLAMKSGDVWLEFLAGAGASVGDAVSGAAQFSLYDMGKTAWSLKNPDVRKQFGAEIGNWWNQLRSGNAYVAGRTAVTVASLFAGGVEATVGRADEATSLISKLGRVKTAAAGKASSLLDDVAGKLDDMQLIYNDGYRPAYAMAGEGRSVLNIVQKDAERIPTKVQKEFNKAMKEAKEGASGAKIKIKGDYTPEYTKKLQDAYKIFKNQGHELSEHSLNRLLGRINQGKIGSIDDVLNTLKSGTKYVDTVNGGTVVFKDGISIHMAEDGTIKTVIGNAKVKSTWEVIK